MALTESSMLTLNTKAPDFVLPDFTGAPFTRDLLAHDNGLLVVFICNHCPFVKHYAQALMELGRDCDIMGVGVVAINSNDTRLFPQDSPVKMAEFAKEHEFDFPYLYDETQRVARDYQAACTPDFFLFNQKLRLVYRGRFDDSSPHNDKPITGKDLYRAINAETQSLGVTKPQHPSIGCNIKWREARDAV